MAHLSGNEPRGRRASRDNSPTREWVVLRSGPGAALSPAENGLARMDTTTSSALRSVDPARASRAQRARHAARWLTAHAALLFGLGALACTKNAQSTARACEASECGVEGAACFQGECSAPCETTNDCSATHYCERVLTDAAEEGRFCVALFPESDSARSSGRTGKYESCGVDSDCDVGRGFSCVDGSCVLAGCGVDYDCGGVGPCVDGTRADGGATRYCKRTEGWEAQPKAPELRVSLGVSCAFGSEPRAEALKADGSCGAAKQALEACNAAASCTPSDALSGCLPACAREEDVLWQCLLRRSPCDDALGHFCLSAGEGDASAYCTAGCGGDAACADGFACEALRSAAAPCEAQCGVKAGTTGCIPSADIGEGKAYECGPMGLLRHLCVRAKFCSPCETDADCSRVPGQVCAKDKQGVKVCTAPCDPNPALKTCPGGNASECGVFDSDRGFATCSHRAGTCSAKDGAACEPCRDDLDCGAGGLCLARSSGERFCVDLTFKCDCGGEAVDDYGLCTGNCPKAPSGLQMKCLPGEPEPGTLVGHCLGVSIEPGPIFEPAKVNVSCWPLP